MTDEKFDIQYKAAFDNKQILDDIISHIREASFLIGQLSDKQKLASYCNMITPGDQDYMRSEAEKILSLRLGLRNVMLTLREIAANAGQPIPHPGTVRFLLPNTDGSLREVSEIEYLNATTKDKDTPADEEPDTTNEGIFGGNPYLADDKSRYNYDE